MDGNEFKSEIIGGGDGSSNDRVEWWFFLTSISKKSKLFGILIPNSYILEDN